MMNKFVFKNLEIISSIDHKLGDSLKDYAGVLSWHASIHRSKLKLSFYHLSLAGTDELLLGSNVLGAFCPQCSACSVVQAKDFNGYTIESDVDGHLKLLLEQLRYVCRSAMSHSLVQKKLGSASILIILSVIDEIDLIRLLEQHNPAMVIVLYQSPSDWKSWLLSSDLDELQSTLLKHRIMFQGLQTSSMANSVCRLIRSQLLGCVNSILIAGYSTAENLGIYKFIASTFLYRLRAGTGGVAVDELMMLAHTNANLKNDLLIFQKPKQITSQSFVIVGSGPSLDVSLADIKRLQSSNFIVSAGSSLGTLLLNGIFPDFHVHVERGGGSSLTSVYRDLLLKAGISDFGDIVGVVPTSIEPSICDLYQTCLLYSRPGQSPLSAWPGLASAKLEFEGPECLSAAFAFVCALGPRRVLMFGCDLGSASEQKLRSSDSVGHSHRTFPLKAPGNITPYVGTNREMKHQIAFMQAAANSCESSPQILNFSDGVKLSFADSCNSTADLCDNHFVCSRADLLRQVVTHNHHQLFGSVLSDSLLSKHSLAFSQWFSEWLKLSSEASDSSFQVIRLKASSLLSFPEKKELVLAYKIFRGTLRDAFWLTSAAVEKYAGNAENKKECWKAFECLVSSLKLECDVFYRFLSESGNEKHLT